MPGYRLYCGNIKPDAHTGTYEGSEGVINIWLIDIRKQIPFLAQLEQVLSPAERMRAARFHQQKDAQQFTITRAILRILLSDTLMEKPGEITILSSDNKKPVLAYRSEVQFNVSHAENYAVIAISKQPVGIDIEFIKPGFDYHSVAEYAFSTAESDYLKGSSIPDTDFYRIWTRKEAFLKGLGSGLVNDLKQISCLDAANDISSTIEGVSSDWELKTIDLSPAYIMSIAYERTAILNQIFLFDFSQAAL